MIKVVAIILFFHFSIFANPIDDYSNFKKEIDEIQKTLNAQKEEMKSIEKSVAGNLKKIEIISQKIESETTLFKKASREYDKLKNQISKIESAVSVLLSDIEILKKQISRSHIYLLDNYGLLNIKILLFSKGYHDTVKNMELIERINMRLFDKLSQVDAKKTAVEKLKNDLEMKKSDMELILKIRNQAKKELDDERLRYKQLLAMLTEDKESKKQYIAMLNKRNIELQSKIEKLNPTIAEQGGDELLRSSFYSMKGKLNWPVYGNIIEHYGKKKIEEFDGEIFNKGIKIAVKDEGYIKPVFKGEVKYIDNVRGYGNIVIVNHDKFFYTLYSNMDEVFVTLGQAVDVNDKIGIVDVDVVGVEPYLYFEIRKQNIAVNPEEWLTANGGIK